MKFKILRGTHSNGERHPQTNKLITYRAGDIFESITDLVKLHGREKFERAADNAVLSRTPLKVNATETPHQEASAYTAKELEGMSVDELKRLANEEEIDIGNLNKKNDIIARIVNVGKVAVPA